MEWSQAYASRPKGGHGTSEVYGNGVHLDEPDSEPVAPFSFIDADAVCHAIDATNGPIDADAVGHAIDADAVCHAIDAAAPAAAASLDAADGYDAAAASVDAQGDAAAISASSA